MDDSRLLDKIETVERCVRRAREEYFADPETFQNNFTRQDAAILNVQRACDTCIDIGFILIRTHKLGFPGSTREVFDILTRTGWISGDLLSALKGMVGYRNVALHQYVELSFDITVGVITRGLDDCLAFSRLVLTRLAPPPASA